MYAHRKLSTKSCIICVCIQCLYHCRGDPIVVYLWNIVDVCVCALFWLFHFISDRLTFGQKLKFCISWSYVFDGLRIVWRNSRVFLAFPFVYLKFFELSASCHCAPAITTIFFFGKNKISIGFFGGRDHFLIVSLRIIFIVKIARVQTKNTKKTNHIECHTKFSPEKNRRNTLLWRVFLKFGVCFKFLVCALMHSTCSAFEKIVD